MLSVANYISTHIDQEERRYGSTATRTAVPCMSAQPFEAAARGVLSMVRVMIFIDGTWLYLNRHKLRGDFGDPSYQIDYAKVPKVLSNIVAQRMGHSAVDVVRTFFFASYPKNYDREDEEAVRRQIEFFRKLKQEFSYDVELFPIDFEGHRISARNRESDEMWRPREKCVDIALASTMLYYAALPYVYDIAIPVVGDIDYKPVFQHLRRLGKRIMIASIKGSCAREYYDPEDSERLADYPTVFLNDLLDEIKLEFPPRQYRCAKCGSLFWTTYQAKTGERVYCDSCRASYKQLKHKAEESQEDETGTSGAVGGQEGA